MYPISSAGVLPHRFQVSSMPVSLAASNLNNREQKGKRLAYIIEKTRDLYNEMCRLVFCGFYNRKIKRSISVIIKELIGSLPEHRHLLDPRIDAKPRDFEHLRLSLVAVSECAAEKLLIIKSKHLLAGYLSTSRTFYNLQSLIPYIQDYAR